MRARLAVKMDDLLCTDVELALLEAELVRLGKKWWSKGAPGAIEASDDFSDVLGRVRMLRRPAVERLELLLPLEEPLPRAPGEAPPPDVAPPAG